MPEQVKLSATPTGSPERPVKLQLDVVPCQCEPCECAHPSSEPSLRRLGVVYRGGATAANELTRMYKAARGSKRVSALHGGFDVLEGTLSAPLAAMQAWSQKLLLLADSTCDAALSKADDTIAGARARLHAALENARKCSDPDAALEMASDAWERFAAVPAVQQLLARAQPATRAGHAAFVKAHDAVVAHPLYARAVEGASQAACAATHSSPYKLGARYMYPYVSRIADPTIEGVSRSKAIKSACEYWSPVKSVAAY